MHNALKLERFLSLPYIKSLGPSKNVFFNFYHQLCNVVHYDSFAEFVSILLGIDMDEVNSGKDFILEATPVLSDILKGLGISIETPPIFDDYQKYQYKDNTIASEIKQVTSEDVVKEQFEQFTEDVKEVLKEELGVSDEAIEAAMQTLGLQFQDLLNQNNLANLVAELTGADSVPQLLCSEQFVNVLQSVNDIGKDILNALDMSLEEFQSAVAKVMDDNAGSSDAVTGQETEASVDEAVVTDQTVTEDTSASTQKFVVEDGRQTK